MDKRFNNFGRIPSKKVWWIDERHFTSDKGTRNGKQKALDYAHAYLLNDKDIIEFDSEMEWKRFEYLHALEKNGDIRELKIHQNFLLLPKFDDHDELMYEADFYYYDNTTQKYVVEDVKGLLEDTFRVKWKLFDYIYKKKDLKLVCIKCSGKNFLTSEAWSVVVENKKPTKQKEKLRAENKAMKEKLKAIEKINAVVERETKRLNELQAKQESGAKLTKAERDRLELLLSKYCKPQKIDVN